MPKVHQASLGIERQVTQNLSVQASYQMLRGRNQIRSININAPDESGVRPDPSMGTVTQFDSTGHSQSDRLELRGTYRIPGRNIFMNMNYALAQVKNHADSATALPANNFDPNAEWGPSRQDVRHRVQGMINVPLFLGVRTSVNVQAQSAIPYTITTGRDDNGDGVANDRPVGVGRNTERGATTWTVNLNVTKQFAIGGPRGGQAGGRHRRPGRWIRRRSCRRPGWRRQSAGAVCAGSGWSRRAAVVVVVRAAVAATPRSTARYSMEFFIRADNVLNNVNYGSFSGNMLSQFFGQPTSAQQPRRLTVGSSFRF